MVNEPASSVLAALPRLYATEEVPPEEKVIHLHFFIGGCHWYVAEFDGKDVFFGFANLNDPVNAEWGYFLLSELREIRISVEMKDGSTGRVIAVIPQEVECDATWRPRRFATIK